MKKNVFIVTDLAKGERTIMPIDWIVDESTRQFVVGSDTFTIGNVAGRWLRPDTM